MILVSLYFFWPSVYLLILGLKVQISSIYFWFYSNIDCLFFLNCLASPCNLWVTSLIFSFFKALFIFRVWLSSEFSSPSVTLPWSILRSTPIFLRLCFFYSSNVFFSLVSDYLLLPFLFYFCMKFVVNLSSDISWSCRYCFCWVLSFVCSLANWSGFSDFDILSFLLLDFRTFIGLIIFGVFLPEFRLI